MSDKDVLLSMGFDPARVEWALKATGNRGLQPAMDFILENEGKPVPDLSSVTSSSAPAPAASGADDPMDEDDEELETLKAVYGKKLATGSGGSAPAASGAGNSAEGEAKSIRCQVCGKTFKNLDLANYHAEKSGHDQFEESTEEIKPLTEEEKKQKLAELKERLAAKRAAKAKEEAKESLANEAIRRKAGKDMNQIREEMKQKELIKEAEKKRKEKLEDAKARAAVKAQIEADKRERAAKAAREKALREGKAVPEQSAPAPAAAPAASSAPKASKDYPETRLQIRMASGGQPYVTTLPSDATLREVAEFLAAQTLAVNVDTVKFSLTFPRKTFAPEDFSRSLRDLGLTPSAVLIAS
ncbi:ubiquitin-related domain-containing protein [Cubamyces lactineus]|nr:ubiquitin-related domain-containing protein [Cubamyces lactineus]